jgi:hypothetical protein
MEENITGKLQQSVKRPSQQNVAFMFSSLPSYVSHSICILEVKSKRRAVVQPYARLT